LTAQQISYGPGGLAAAVATLAAQD
jgi:hypothetical protein